MASKVPLYFIILIQGGDFKCVVCEKICKTIGGLTRHMNKRHPEKRNQSTLEISAQEKESTAVILQVPAIKRLMRRSFVELYNDECYPDEIRGELTKCVDLPPTDLFVQDIRNIYEKFSSRPDPEKFYGCYLASVPMKASTYFPSLSPHAATMTIMKFAELLLVYHKQSSVTNVQEKSKDAQSLSDRDIDSLQYLGGYILRNIFRKLKKSSKVDSSESQQIIAVLEASRIKVDTKHKLVSTLNKGELWATHGDMQKIFVCCETQFRESVNSI